MNSLKEIGIKYGTDKVQHGYLDVYYEYFSRFREKEINILEIGVYNGASMFTWREFFPNANIIGVDIEDKTSIFNRLPGKKEFFKGDQGDYKFVTYFCETILNKTNRGFDIVIDDGSHFQYDLMVSLGYIFPYVNSGGAYVLEDMCVAERLNGTSNWWGNEDHWKSSTLPGMKKSARTIKKWLPGGEMNIEHCAEATMQRLEKTGVFNNAFLSEDDCKYINDNYQQVRVYPALTPPIQGTSSIAVITKKNRPEERNIFLEDTAKSLNEDPLGDFIL